MQFISLNPEHPYEGGRMSINVVHSKHFEALAIVGTLVALRNINTEARLLLLEKLNKLMGI